jgi:Domain of unknown function (DUF1508)
MYQDLAKKWRWRLIADNGQKVAWRWSRCPRLSPYSFIVVRT